MRVRRLLHRRLVCLALGAVVAASCGGTAAAPPARAQRAVAGGGPRPAAVTEQAAAAAAATPADGTGALDALAVLAGLRVERPHLGAPRYARDQWPHWQDIDGDGCDTRDEVLLEEALAAPAVRRGCTLGGGRWASPYDGHETGDLGRLDVDHLVPLAEAHRSGGWAWEAAAKAAYANDVSDPRTLVAVTAASNRSKGERDPAGWLPDEDVCRYAGDWLAVKARWGLSVDAEEATELSDLLLGECAGATLAPWPPPAAAPEPVAGTPYPSCSAADAADAAPLRRGEPGYAPHLDGDTDGIACE